MKCNILIDWLTFVVRDTAVPQHVITGYLGMDPGLFQEQPYGLNGYNHVLRFNDIFVMYEPAEGSTNARNMGVCVSMSGNGCRCFETYSKSSIEGISSQGTLNTAFPSLFAHIVTSDCNVTRIDIACDDHDGVLDMDDIYYCYDNNNINSRMSKRQFVGSRDGNSISGACFYLGAPQSDFRVRIYDKAKEQGDYQGHWIRVELVLKGKNALAFVQNFVNCDSIGTLTAGLINDKFSFIVRDDVNISRCSTCGWWLEFVGSIEAIQILSREVVQHEIDEVRDWIVNQVAPSLGLLFKALGSAEVWEIMKDGADRLSRKQQATLDDYRALMHARAAQRNAALNCNCDTEGQLRLWA